MGIVALPRPSQLLMHSQLPRYLVVNISHHGIVSFERLLRGTIREFYFPSEQKPC